MEAAVSSAQALGLSGLQLPAPLTPFGEDFGTQDCHLQEWALDPSLPIVLVDRGHRGETRPGVCPRGSQDSGRGRGITGHFHVIAGRWGEVGSR